MLSFPTCESLDYLTCCDGWLVTAAQFTGDMASSICVAMRIFCCRSADANMAYQVSAIHHANFALVAG